MIIKTVTIENFRCYYGSNTINLKDGLILVIGDNGDGKTTFYEALEWLFDTSKQNMDLNLISKKRLSELANNQSSTLRVFMKFEHDGEKVIEKSFSFNKFAPNRIICSDYQFNGWESRGPERIPIDGSVLLDRCFDVPIRKYCLFKGEDNLNVFNNSEALKYLIETFSDLRQFDPYFTGDENKPGFTDFAAEQSSKAYTKAMRSDEHNKQAESILSSRKEQIKKKLSNIRSRLQTNIENDTKYTTLLQEIENKSEASNLLKSINERLKALEAKKFELEKIVDEDYSIKLLDDYWILCGFAPILKEYHSKVNKISKDKRIIEDEDKRKKGKKEAMNEIVRGLETGIMPLSIYIPDESSMREMIEDEFCKVCGRKAKKGTGAYEFMVNKLNELLKSQLPIENNEVPLFKNNYIKELEEKSISLGYHQNDLNNLRTIIEDRTELNLTLKNDIKKIQDEINLEKENKTKLLSQNGTFTEEELKNAFENIRNWYNAKSDAEKQIIELEREKKNLEDELSTVQMEYDNLAKDSIARTFCKIHAAFDRIQTAFKYAKEKNTHEFLTLLRNKANYYLERLNIEGFHGTINILENPDGSARIVLRDKNEVLVHSPNQALKTTMYMSVLFAVSEITSITRENDYPLIFDAPTSSFSPPKENDFFKVISEIKKQCIIFSKSFITDKGKIDESKIGQLKCTVYRMTKKKPFDKNDLTTIQTELTLVKN